MHSGVSFLNSLLPYTSTYLVCWNANDQPCSLVSRLPYYTMSFGMKFTCNHKTKTMSEEPNVVAALVSQSQDWIRDDDEEYEEEDPNDDNANDFSMRPPSRTITYRKIWWCLAIDKEGKSYYPASGAPDNVMKGLWDLAEQEFGGRPENGVFFLKGAVRKTKQHVIKGYRCSFYHQSKCKQPCYRVVYSKRNEMYRIETAHTDAHSNHSKYLVSRGAPKAALVNSIRSPSALRKTPKQLLGVASRKAATEPQNAMKYTSEQQKSIARKVHRLRLEFSTKDLQNGGDGSHYGDVVETILRKYARKNIDNFNKDSVYLLKDEVHLHVSEDDEQSVRFYCVLSTENLLLNAPRQQSSGQEIVLAVDGSYRYVVERDHGLFVVKCVNHSQTAKMVAYAICNREDEQALTWIFKAIKEETERIVNGLIEDGIEWM